MLFLKPRPAGATSIVFHSEALDLAVLQRVTMVDELRAALDRGEFEVYYQPQVEVPSRQIIGVEALLRWNHPSRGLLTPGRFIAIAEKTGMIGPIGQWVLAEVRRQLRDLGHRGDLSAGHRRQPVRGPVDLAIRLFARSHAGTERR